MRKLALGALVPIFALACSTVRVTTDYDPDFDFAVHDAYAWLDTKSGVQGDREDVSSLLDRRIRAAVDAELAGKGLRRVDASEAPLLVVYRLSVDQKIDVDTIHTGVGYGRGWYGRVGTTETVVREYEEGTLLVDVIDATSRELVWRGSGQSRLRESSTPEQRDERIRAAVAEILEGFPPGRE